MFFPTGPFVSSWYRTGVFQLNVCGDVFTADSSIDPGPHELGTMKASATIDRESGVIDVNASIPFGLGEISQAPLF